MRQPTSTLKPKTPNKKKPNSLKRKPTSNLKPETSNNLKPATSNLKPETLKHNILQQGALFRKIGIKMKTPAFATELCTFYNQVPYGNHISQLA